MIRKFNPSGLDAVMELWLSANLDAHHFIPAEYWTGNFEMVSQILPQAEVYVYDNPSTGTPAGFIGLTDTYIAGLFVNKEVRSQGIGKKLLDHAKSLKPELTLKVYQQNTRAVEFYKREGFAATEEVVDEDTGALEYVMAWKR